MSDRDSARHRDPRRPSSPLSDLGDAVTGRLNVVGRSGAVLAVSTGLIGTVALPTQAYGADTQSLPVISADTSATMVRAAGTGPMSFLPVSSNTVLTAPLTGTPDFQSSAFRAVPAPVAPRATRTAPAVTTSSSGRRTAAPTQASTAKHSAADAIQETSHRGTARHVAPAVPTKAGVTKAGATKTSATKTTATKSGVKKVGGAKTAGVKATPKTGPKSTTPRKSPPKTPTEHTRHAPARAKKKAHDTTPPKTAPVSSARGSAVIAVAARYVGTPYRYGGTTPRGFDCSGFTGYVYRQLGIALPRTANQQMMATHRITRSQARPGDLVFFVSAGRAYHVGIYAGRGMMYAAPHSGARVQKERIWDAAAGYGRVTR